MINVVPIAGRHAIKAVSFGLEWQEPLQEDLLTFLMALHAKVRDKLPRVIRHEEIPLKVVLSQAQPEQEAPVKPQLASVTFDALQRNGEQEWSLVIQRNFLAVNCYVYTRWNEIWGIGRELLTPFLPVIARERGISVIGLQYVDQFRVTGSCEHFRAGHLLREGSRFVPTQAFQLDDLWHSHHGFFEKLTEPTAHRRLNHVNVDVVDTNDERVIQITTAHRALLDRPAKDESRLLNSGGEGEWHHYMDQLHKVNKQFLCELLNEDMCKQIGLKEEQ